MQGRRSGCVRARLKRTGVPCSRAGGILRAASRGVEHRTEVRPLHVGRTAYNVRGFDSGRSRALLSFAVGFESTHRTPDEEHLIKSNQLAALAAHICEDKKAVDIRVLDVSQQIQIADYFVIVCGLSRPQIRALHKELHARLKRAGAGREHTEGVELGWWILMDYGDVVVHLMQPEAREYYDIDGLYRECGEVDWRAIELPELAEPATMRIAE
jgi:ribosome-associated protein